MKQTKNKKVIGIIGGMGPEATTDLYMKIIRYYQVNFGAKYDNDFPEFMINSVPIPDVVESLENEEITLNMLINSAIKLEQSKCDFIVIACNSVQFLLDDIQKNIKIPIMGIAKVNASLIKNKGYKKVGILSSKTTVVKRVYDNDLNSLGINLIVPSTDEQEIVTNVIMNQLAGTANKKDTENLKKISERLKKRGAEAVLLACTELPLVINQEDSSIQLIDCTQTYAEKAALVSLSK